MKIDEIVEKIALNCSNRFSVPKDDISQHSQFHTFGANSIDIVEIIVDMENEFQICVPDSKLVKLLSVGSLAKCIDSSMNPKPKKKYTKRTN